MGKLKEMGLQFIPFLPVYLGSKFLQQDYQSVNLAGKSLFLILAIG